MLVVIFTITSIVSLAYITAEISRMGIGVLQLAPFDSSMIVTLWQVQATVVTLAFVVSIFFWESLLSETPYNEVLRLFIRYTHSLFGVTFSLTATATSGLLLLHQSTPGTDTDRLPLFIGYAVILLSTSTYLLVIWMFRRTAGILVYGEDEKLISDIAQLGIDKELTWGKRDIERRLREQWWGTSQTTPVTAFTQKEVTEFKADSLNMTGVTTDLNLVQIKRLVELAESEGLTVEAIPQIGRNLDAAQNATLFAVEGEVTEDLKKDIESTVGSAVVTRQRKGFKW
jgi:hypothetical protein